MKCPKCGYLGFESRDRCRNCGYEFSLAVSAPVPATLDFPVDQPFDEPLIPSRDAPAGERPALDLNRVIGVSPDDLPLFPPLQGGGNADDAPLITSVARPRAPLGVRRATPEIPRARVREVRRAGEMLFERPAPSVLAHHLGAHSPSEAPAAPSSRIVAALVDFSLLFALDAAVLYFTLRLCGLTLAETLELPVGPLAAFFMLLNGGYFIAFTAVGGQSIGKMAVGIKVISRDDGAVPIGRATLRTLAYLASALPLGAGFLPGVLGSERLALHDRLAHTRVVRPL